MANKHEKKHIKGLIAKNKPTLIDKIKEQRPGEAKTKVSMNLKLAFLLGLISCLVYANTLKDGFVLDDYSVITANTIVTKGISAIPELLTTPHMRGFFVTSHDIYRPLSLVMFAAEHQFFGENPMPYHLFNILLFACCVILLFLFLEKLFLGQNTFVAFVAALLFALHPIHTEVVANIKSRDELLCFFFAFLCLNMFARYIHTGKLYRLILGTCCFFLALLSKETVITFLAIIPLIFFFYLNENKKRSACITVFIGITAVIFLVIKFQVLSLYHANENTYVSFMDNALAKQDISIISRIATATLILGYYLKLLFIPYPLICDYSYNSIPITGFNNAGVLISLAAYILLAVFSIKRFQKNHKDPYAFGIFYYLITMSLFTNILFLLGTTMGERLLFFPSVSFCLVAALIVRKLAGQAGKVTIETLKSSKVLALIIPECLVFAVLTFNRNSEWLNNYTLYKTDIKKSPDNSKLYFDLGHEMSKNMYPQEQDTVKRKQIITESIVLLKKAIKIFPGYEEAHTELGATYFRYSDYDSSEVYEKRALVINPKNILAINNLAAVYFIRKRYSDAIVLYRNAINLQPDFINPYTNAGLCYQYTGNYDSSIYFLEKAIEIDPNFEMSYEILATTYKLIGKLDKAKKYEAIAQKSNPAFKM